jgi:hypothetical protein
MAFYIKLIKPNGTLIGRFRKLDPCRKRLESLQRKKGNDFAVRVRGSDETTEYSGETHTVTSLLASLPTS